MCFDFAVLKQETTISENSNIIKYTTEICEKFNSFFVTVAKEIGDSAVYPSFEDHQSIQVSKTNTPPPEQEFYFKPVSEAKVSV